MPDPKSPAQKDYGLDTKYLIEALQLKNQNAFAYIYDLYSAPLLNSICKTVRSTEIAEDILQNSFVKIWLKIDTYSPEKASLFTWMRCIAHNESVDYLRSKQAKHAFMTFSLTDKEHLGGVCNGSSDMARYDFQSSLAELPQKERVIIDLYKRGFTCSEIGQLISIPEGTVKTKMRVIYKKLRLIHS